MRNSSHLNGSEALSKPLRDYQLSALERGSVALQSGARSVLLCMPTGTGKTRTAVEACVRHHALGGLPLCVAPRRELVVQMTETLERAGLAPGVDVFVDTIQGILARFTRGEALPAFTLIVWDEARHYVSDGWSQLYRLFADAVHLGLDATPERGDGKGLGGMFEVLIDAISIRSAIAAKYLVPFEVLRPDRFLPPGDIAQDPLEFYFAKASGTKAVVFCRSVEDARALAWRFRDRDLRSAAVWGDMPSADRDATLKAFEEGTLDVITNMNLLTEGWDAPIAETIILARSFGTAGGMIQACGRGARPFPGKTRCLVGDLTGCTHLDHVGEPDDERTWQLHGLASQRPGQGVDIRFCPVCGQPVTSSECAACGYAGEEMRKRKPRVLGLPVERFAKQRAETDEQKAKKLAFYMHDARSSGHRVERAFYRFRGVYGHMPTPTIKALARRT